MINDPIGKVIKSYELEGLLGTGGFGAVYRAKQAVVDREVAIKIIWPAFASHPNFIRRFETEAQLVASLEHPYIVPLYDYWRDPEGAYIVMRYIRGGALGDAMNGAAWSLPDINRLLGQVTAALAMAHRAGVVHRDIKPENILLDNDGNAYLADFGIAQILSNAQEEDSLIAGMGSPAYAAPEQVTGGDISKQSDLYSLGVILYELLTGEHPFPQLERLSGTQLTKLRATEPLPPLMRDRPDLPRALNDVLQRVTAINPDERHADALALTRDFRNASGRSGRAYDNSVQIPDTDEVLPNPYKGLRPFQESDAANFFGRETLVERLVRRLRETNEYNRFLAIVGPSGSGKSSVVKAGLIPQLRDGALSGSEAWFYDEIVPGEKPFEEVASTLVSLAVEPPDDLLAQLRRDERGLLEAVNTVLPDDDTDFFLMIDQFEELFTLVDDDALIEQFLNSLYVAVTDPASRLRVVITIRADFYDKPLLQPRLSDLVRERTEVVVPLSDNELERVIVQPARRAGVMIDSGLVAAIIAEVKEQPGALPLLQYSLSELFERRQGNVITQQAYREIGGVRGALARRADELYESLAPDEQAATRQLLLRLITLGEGTEDTRRRALLSEVTAIRDENAVYDPATMQRVIDKLGTARLLTFDRDPVTRSPTVEVTHEAIIREWSTLRMWLDESRNDVRMQRNLSQLAQEWHDNERDISYLLRGVRLDSCEKWAETTKLALTEQERDYLAQSIAERCRREAKEQARQERERQLEQQSITRLRLLAGVLVIAFIGALALSGFALNESRRATSNAQFSQSIAWEAGARRALSDNDADLALMLALRANAMDDPPVQSQSTLAEVAFAPATRAVLPEHTAQVNSVDINAQGIAATASTDATVKLWESETGALRQTLQGHDGDVLALAFSPDGTHLISAASDFVAIVWDVETGDELQRFEGHSRPIQAVAWSPDGSQVVTGGSDNLLIAWDATTGAEIQRYSGHVASVLSVAWSPDGSRIISGARDGTLYLWDVRNASLRGELDRHDTAINALAYRPDGQFAVSADADGRIYLWDMALGIPERQFVTGGEEIRSIAFTPDGQRVYSGAANGIVQIWNTNTGLEANRLRGHDDAVLSVSIRPDGQRAVSGSADDTARLWNIGQPAAAQQLTAHTARVSRVAVSDDGRRVVTSSVDDTVRLWNAVTGELLNTITFEDRPLLAMALAPDGERALVGSREGFLVEVDLASGETLHTLTAHTDTVEAVVYLPDGERALSAGLDDVVLLWDIASGEVVRRYEAHENGIYALALTPNGEQFVSTSSDQTALLWNIDSGEVVQRYEGHEGAVYAAAINAGGTRLVTGGRDEQAILWNLETGAEMARLAGDTETVWGLDFSPDGTRVLAGSGDGQAVIWDVATGNVLQNFSLNGDIGIFDVAFAADGQQAYTAQENGIVTVWRTFQVPSLIQWVRQNRYVREWSCLERERYRITPTCDAQDDF